MARTPVYFLSHGGPNIMFDTQHPAHGRLRAIGHEIVHRVRPRAIVVFSAHWQGRSDGTIEVNTSPNPLPLIYDFYNFPAHYYSQTYPHRTSPALATRILTLLNAAHIPAVGVSRGLDHGVWAGFKVAFPPDSEDSLTGSVAEIPIVQVSLFADGFEEKHLALGAALAPLRDEGIVVMGSGMAGHNLRDWGGPARGYVKSFDEALREAVEGDGKERDERMKQLLGRNDAKMAHPSWEHLMPVFVAAGAAEGEKGERMWTLIEGGLGWAQFRFGEVGEEV